MKFVVNRKPGRSLKRVSLCLLLCFAMAGLAGCGSSKKPSNVIDLGEVIAGPPMNCTFNVVNTGQKPFRVVKIDKSCSCQKTTFDPDKLVQPGEAARVTVEAPTKGHEGRLNYHFIVSTDSEGQQIPLLLTAVVKAKIKAVPSELSFGGISVGAVPVRKLVVSSLEVDPKAKLTSFEVRQEFPVVRAELRESAAAGTAVFDVSIAKDAPIGDVIATLMLNFADQEVPKIEVPITGRIDGAIDPTPHVIVTDREQDSHPVLKLASRDGKAFKVLKISQDPAFQLTAVSPEDKHLYRLTCSSSVEPGHYSILFYTDHPDQKVVSVPIIVH